jgi:FixJ family two-component response regulator
VPGFEVSPFGSVEEFLSSRSPLAPICALVGVHCGRLSGLDLARLQAQCEPVVPVIFLTDNRDFTLRSAILESGRPCLVKPVDEQALLSTIARVSGTG